MALARPTFLRMHEANGSQSAICMWCVRSIGKGLAEEELQLLEQAHECDHSDLQRFAPGARRRASQVAALGRAVGDADSRRE